MYNNQKRNELVEQFIENVNLNVRYLKEFCDLHGAMKRGDSTSVKNLIGETARVFSAAVPEEVDIPEVSVFSTMSGDEGISLINLALRNRYSSEYTFKIKNQFVISEDVFEVFLDFFKCSYTELINYTLVRDNLVKVNAKLKEIITAAGNTFKVTIVPPLGNEGKKIIKITDDEIVYVADEDKALALDDILVFSEPSELVTEDIIKQGFEGEVANFAQAQTTPQFIGVSDPLIGYICDISKLVKPYTLIKKVYSKNVKRLRSNKETFAYYLEDKVFAVVLVNEDGKEVALKPFNIDTLEVVDVDVLANI